MKKALFLTTLTAISLIAGMTRDTYTVTDSDTGLQWQDSYPEVDSSGKMVIAIKNWTGAIGYCEALTLDNYSDWRLPNINELLTIVDYTKQSPAINAAFQNTASDLYGYYWSSTTYASYTGAVWAVAFNVSNFYNGGGYSYYDGKVYGRYVRCVRGGTINSGSSTTTSGNTTTSSSTAQSSGSTTGSTTTGTGSTSSGQSTGATTGSTTTGSTTTTTPPPTPSSGSVTLSVQSGWNMLSSPVNGQKIDANYVKSSGVSAIWAYNATTGLYVAPSYIEPGVGYWVKASATKSIQVPSSSLFSSNTMSINQTLSSAVPDKWNLLGTQSDTTKTALMSLGNTKNVWWYDPAIGNYSQNDAIKAGSGFWYMSSAAVAASGTSGTTSTTTTSGGTCQNGGIPGFCKPTRAACEAACGSNKSGCNSYWNETVNECEADWNNSTKICALPTAQQWQSLYVTCGAATTTINPNYAYDYGGKVSGITSCMESKGFTFDSRNSAYWSSTEYSSSVAWLLYCINSPASGLPDMWATSHVEKRGWGGVRCAQ